MKTVIHAYQFNTGRADEAAAYDALCAQLTAQGLKCFETWGDSGSHYLSDLDGKAIELETEHLFDNQWNTAPIEGDEKASTGRRVFDWAQDYAIDFSRKIKKGHWIEQTAEMRDARRNRVHCNYCGKQEPAAKGYVFCPHCLDSQYLKESDLRLTRMTYVCDKATPAELTEAEKAHLLPLYREAQLHGSTDRGKRRLAKARQDVAREYEKAVRVATIERDGKVWLMDHGVSLENVIYYSHTEKFSFGWRTPLSESIASGLLDILVEFPFEYEMKREGKAA